MPVVRLRDRDAIVTNEGIIFRVLGYSHPTNFYACDAEYAPSNVFKSNSPKALRNKGERVFYKFYEDEAWSFLKNSFPQYIIFHGGLGKKIVGVYKDDISEIRKPEEKFRILFEQTFNDELIGALHNVVDLVKERAGLSLEDFGVFGSMLHGFHHPKFSDVDLTVYGTQKVSRLRQALHEMFMEHDSALKNEFESDQAVAGKRWLFRNLSVQEFVLHQRRKLIYALFDDAKSGRVIKTEFEPVRAWEEVVNECDSTAKVEQCGWVRLIARVIDDSKTPFMPSIYKIEPLNVLSGPRSVLDAVQVVSFIEEFRLQAFRDETVYVEGNLERVEKKNDSRYQITLTYCPRYYEQALKALTSNKP